MKRFLAFCLAAAMAASTAFAQAPQPPEIAARNYILVDLNSNQVLAEREAIGHVDEIDGISAGGMPDRVKCLHVLAGQALAQGRGVNPLGDEVLDALGDWWAAGLCVDPDGA